MPKHIIIGGSDAGVSAALRIKELDPAAEVIMFLKDAYPNYSICGIPFFLSGEVKDWKTLAHRRLEDIQDVGIEVLPNQTVLSLNTRAKIIVTEKADYKYDKLLLATGAKSVFPDMPGNNLPGVFTLRWIDEMLEIDRYIRQHHVKKVIIVGGGYIGTEMADALVKRKLKVSLIEPSGTILKTLDESFGRKIQKALSLHSVEIFTNQRAKFIRKEMNGLRLETENGLTIEADLILLATGAKPNTIIDINGDLEINTSHAYSVNRSMQTSADDVFAAGDCAETWHPIINEFRYMPLGTTAHKQGRIAGENMAGKLSQYAGSIGTQVVKVFDLVAGRTGLNEKDCFREGLAYRTIESEYFDHKRYYPHAERLFIRIIGHPVSRKLLGVQIIGSIRSEISKRLDIAASAIQNEYNVEQLNDLDLSYTPPLSSPWDPLQMAAQEWMKQYEQEDKMGIQ